MVELLELYVYVYLEYRVVRWHTSICLSSLLRLPSPSLSPRLSPPSPVQDKLLAQLYLLRIEVVEDVVGGGEEGPDAEDEGEQTAREVPVKTSGEEGGG